MPSTQKETVPSTCTLIGTTFQNIHLEIRLRFAHTCNLYKGGLNSTFCKILYFILSLEASDQSS